jgi:hypothetical protein
VIIHNLGHYDSHYLIQAVGKLQAAGIVTSVDIIPNTSEQYLSIIINKKIKFLDSLAFTLTSLTKLVSTMAKGGTDKFLPARSFKRKLMKEPTSIYSFRKEPTLIL